MLAVLAQNPKGGGLSGTFGGSGAAQQFMGVHRATDILSKLTWGSAATLMLLAVLSNTIMVPDQPQGTANPSANSPNVQEAQRKQFLLDDVGQELLDKETNIDDLLADTTTADTLALPEDIPAK